MRDYNLDIAEYALAAAQPSDPPEKIVAMLIEVDASEETRSVLVPPQMARVVEPVSGSFAAPTQLGTPASIAPTLPSNPLPSAPGGAQSPLDTARARQFPRCDEPKLSQRRLTSVRVRRSAYPTGKAICRRRCRLRRRIGVTPGADAARWRR